MYRSGLQKLTVFPNHFGRKEKNQWAESIQSINSLFSADNTCCAHNSISHQSSTSVALTIINQQENPRTCDDNEVNNELLFIIHAQENLINSLKGLVGNSSCNSPPLSPSVTSYSIKSCSSIDINSKACSSNDINSKSCSSSGINSMSSSSNDINSKSSPSNDTGSSNDINSKSSSLNDINFKSSSSSGINSKSYTFNDTNSKYNDISSKSSSSDDINYKSSSSNDIGSKYNDISSKSSSLNDINFKSSSSSGINSKSYTFNDTNSKYNDISSKSSSSDDINYKSSSSNDIGSKYNGISSKSSSFNDIGSKSVTFNDTNSKYNDISSKSGSLNDINYKSSSSSGINSKSSSSSGIISKSSSSSDISSKSSSSNDSGSKSVTFNDTNSKYNGISSKSSSSNDIGSKSCYINSKSGSSNDINSKNYSSSSGINSRFSSSNDIGSKSCYINSMYNDISSKSSSSNDINSKSCYNNSKSYTFNDSNSKSCSSNYIYSKPDNQYIPDFHAEQVYTSPERQFDRSNFHTISGGKDNFTIREAYEVEPDYVRRLRHTETETETETEGIRNKMVTKSNGRMGQFSQKITSHNQQQFTEENKGNRIQYSQPVTIPNNLKPQVCYESNLNPQVCYESQLNPLVYYESPVNNGREITTKISKPQYSFDVQIPETSESTAKFKREFFREKLRTLTKDSEYTEAQIIIMKKEAYPEKYGKKVIKYNSNELIQPTNYKPLDNKYDSSATEEYIEPYEEISDQLKEILREKLPTLDKDSGYTEQQIKKFHRMAYPPKCKESENGIKQNSYTTNNNEIYSQVNIGTVQSQKLSIKSNTNFNSSQYNEEDAYAEIWGKGNNKSPIKESSPFIEPAFHPVAESSQLNINTKFNSKKLDSIDNLSSGNDVKNRSINSDNSKPSRRPKSDFVEAFKSYQKSRGLPIYDPGDYTESFVDYYSSVNSTDYNSDTDGAIQYMLMIDHHESDIGGQ